MEKDVIMKDIVRIIKDMTSDFDTEYSDEIGTNTYLVSNLDFESVDIIELMTEIEKFYNRRKLPFQKLVVKDGRYRDFTVGELVDFLYKYLNDNQ